MLQKFSPTQIYYLNITPHELNIRVQLQAILWI